VRGQRAEDGITVGVTCPGDARAVQAAGSGAGRCSTIGGRAGARARNSPSRSRGSRFMNARSWVGLATPRVAANASASSASVK